MGSKHIFLTAALMAASTVFPGCEPQQGGGANVVAMQSPEPSYAETENIRLKQLLVQYENDARNAHMVVAEANTRVERASLELDAANKKLSIYDGEVAQLRDLATNAANAVQQAAINNAYASYAATATPPPSSRSTRTSMSDKTAHQLSSLAEQFGGVVVGNRLELPGDFFFDSGKYELNPNARSAIRRMAEILGGENLYLMVVGHTDNDPIKNPALRSKGITDNLHLSLLRAKAVVDELRKAGYPQNLMYPTGWGDQRPLVPNTDKASKKLNRRVDILIDPDASNLFGMSTITGIEPVGQNQSYAAPAYPAATTYGATTTTTYPAATTTYQTYTEQQPTMYMEQPTTTSSYSTTTYSTSSYPATTTYADPSGGYSSGTTTTTISSGVPAEYFEGY